MVTVRFDDAAQRMSCANFLRFTFPGDVRPMDHVQLDFSAALEPGAEQAVVERFLVVWAARPQPR